MFDVFLPPFLLHQSSLWKDAFQSSIESFAALPFPSKTLLWHSSSISFPPNWSTIQTCGHWLNLLGPAKSWWKKAALWQPSSRLAAKSQQCSWQSSRWSLMWSRESTPGCCSSGCWCSQSVVMLQREVPNLHALGWFSWNIVKIMKLFCTSHLKITCQPTAR